MLRDKQKRLSLSLLSLGIITLILMHIPISADLSSLSRNDALPMFTTLSFDERYLLTKDYLYYIEDDSADQKHNRFGFSISPFAQNADRGKTIRGSHNLCPPVIDSCGLTLTDTPIGDLTGRTSMLALLMGEFPNGVTTYPGGATGALSTAFENLLCTTPTNPTVCLGEQGSFNNQDIIDPKQLFGYFSFPIKYRKRGVRFEGAARFYNFGIRIQTGFSTIRQVSEEVINLTNAPGATPTDGLFPSTVNQFLMNELDTIAKDMGYNMCPDFIQTSMEELRFNLFWRQAFPINQEAESYWTRFLLIPYAEVAASVSPGKKQDLHQFFSAPFGNDQHASTGFTTGLNFNFLETIEIGGEVNFTHFFQKSFCMPVPTSEFQNNLYPFSTNVSVRPGTSWHFCARIAAYHFVDKLSMYFEWYCLDHQKDDICLENGDPAFTPGVLECRSSFKTKLGNAGFNYDLSPNIGLGFLWQIPFSQRNTYRSSTLMGGFNVTF